MYDSAHRVNFMVECSCCDGKHEALAHAFSTRKGVPSHLRAQQQGLFSCYFCTVTYRQESCTKPGMSNGYTARNPPNRQGLGGPHESPCQMWPRLSPKAKGGSEKLAPGQASAPACKADKGLTRCRVNPRISTARGMIANGYCLNLQM